MAELGKALTQQHTQLEQLIGVLEQELHLISTRDAEALINLLQEKESLLEGIQKQDTLINTLYHQAQQSGAIDSSIEEQLNQGKRLVEQCKFRTEINAKAVEQGQLKLEHLRNLLVELRSKESMTYDKTGKTQGSSLGKGVSA